MSPITLTTLLVFWCRRVMSELHVLPSNIEQTERIEAVDVVGIEEATSAVVVFFNNNKYYCSGTILHAEWVLTAAHCLYNLKGEFSEGDNSVTVLAGSTSIYFKKEDVTSGKVQLRQSKKVVVHPSYSWSENFVRDLALIKVSEPFNITSRVSTANTSTSLPMEEAVVQDYTGMKDFEKGNTVRCSGYGFGKVLRWQETTSDDNLKVQEYEMSKHCHCLERIRSTRYPYSIVTKNNIFICHTPGHSSGLCDGDAGSQLMCSNRLRAVATTTFHYKVLDTCLSWSGPYNECGDRRSMSVFTDLCYAGGWLHKHVPNYPLHQEACTPLEGIVNDM